MMAELALAVGLAAVLSVTGPGLIVARAVARWIWHAPRARAQAPAIRAGLIAATALAALSTPFFGLAPVVAMACLWLGLSDWAWRWLPLPWLGALGAVGLGRAWLSGEWLPQAVGGLAVAGTLLALQWTYRWVRGQEGLGTGDVLFLGVIALWLDLSATFQVLFFAALLGVIGTLTLKMLRPPVGHRRYGVAFGTYLSLVFAIIVILQRSI